MANDVAQFKVIEVKEMMKENKRNHLTLEVKYFIVHEKAM